MGSDHFSVDGQKVMWSECKDPAEIPWKAWGVDIVLECTGAFKKKSDFEKHIQAGAKRVLVSAPADGADFTVVYGVNHEQYDAKNHYIVSNASCTTNCLAPLVKVLHESFGIEKGLMTTIHSYTNDQRILDGNHSDLRRARAAAMSMIPTTTGAAKTVGKILPEMEGRIDGFSVRVPTPNVSLVDFTFESKKKVSIEEVNGSLIKASETKAFKGILNVEHAPLVSIDFNGNTASSTVDLLSTMVMGENMVKVVSWYDNEIGFSKRMLDMLEYMNDKGL
jgi:glyceraldehyde 3-phosphate dehydrogenase